MWVTALVLVAFWALGMAKGYSFGGILHILLVYAALLLTAGWRNWRAARRAPNGVV